MFSFEESLKDHLLCYNHYLGSEKRILDDICRLVTVYPSRFLIFVSFYTFEITRTFSVSHGFQQVQKNA